MKIPWQDSNGFYPQEVEIKTEFGYLLLSSMEINKTKADIEFTDELLLIEDESIAKSLEIGPYGLGKNERELFDRFDKLKEFMNISSLASKNQAWID